MVQIWRQTLKLASSLIKPRPQNVIQPFSFHRKTASLYDAGPPYLPITNQPISNRKIITTFPHFPPTVQDIKKRWEYASTDAIFMPESGKVEPNSSVAIMIPFRNRTEHLRYFMAYNVQVLRRQNIRFKIYRRLDENEWSLVWRTFWVQKLENWKKIKSSPYFSHA